MDFLLPELGEGVYEAELVEWHVQPGDTVNRGQTLAEVMTDKATMELPSPFAGRIESLAATAGESIHVGQVVLYYQPAAGAPPEDGQQAAAPQAAAATAAAAPTSKPPRRAAERVRAAPSVRRRARELGIDLTQVRGSGPGGRILQDDLAAGGPAAAPAAGGPGAPGKRIKLRGLRRTIAANMVRAKREIPHYSYMDECDVTELVRLRAALKESYLQRGVRLTYLAFVVRAVVAALRDVPLVNASLDEANEEIVLHDACHIGIAVATPGGLIVPVVHDADRLDLAQTAAEIKRLSDDARAGKSQLEDLRGATFTVTSIGSIGGLLSTPIVNPPQVGILGLGKIIRRPVYDANDQLRPADLIYLSFSFDHRVLDGAVGAEFGNAVIERLQNPAKLVEAP